MHVYENYEESQGWSDKEFGAYTASEDGYLKKEMAGIIAAARANSDFRVLDVGFGNGAFIGWCRANNIQCDGLEVNVAQIAKAREAGYTAYSSFDEIKNGKYDAVVGFDVLEHIESTALVAFLRDARKVSCRPSTMLFRFPNGDNPFSLWMQNGDLTHRTFIGSGMIVQASIQAGLTVTKIGDPATSYNGLPIQSKIQVFIGQALRRLIGKFVVALFMSGQKNIRFSPNLMVELANG